MSKLFQITTRYKLVQNLVIGNTKNEKGNFHLASIPYIAASSVPLKHQESTLKRHKTENATKILTSS